MKAVDMHCDTISELYKKRQRGSAEGLYKNNGHIDLGKLREGGALLQNFALFVHLGQTKDPLEEVLRMVDFYYGELAANEALIAPVYRYRDIGENHAAGKLSALLTVEEGGVCKGSVAFLHILYRLGVRMMTLTWNYRNEIGSPNLNALMKSAQPASAKASIRKEDREVPFYRIADTEHGLTETGIEFVKEMERVGMIIDVSHLSDAGFYNVLEVTKRPFVASHSNARTVSGWVRNLTDDMIRRLADRGGVMGLNFCPDFLTEVSDGEKNPGTIAAIVEHAKHITNVGGIDCLGLGSDFDGIDVHGELPDYSFLPRLADALLEGGFTEAQVEKIFFRNVLGLYKELL